jgi:hypothetical protein
VLSDKFLTTEFGLEKEFQDRSSRGVFFIFMPSYVGISFWGRTNKEKKSLNGGKKFFRAKGSIWA